MLPETTTDVAVSAPVDFAPTTESVASVASADTASVPVVEIELAASAPVVAFPAVLNDAAESAPVSS